MDPALLAIATSSANALVSLMATDLWGRAKECVSSIFSRSSKSTNLIEQELEESKKDLTASIERGDIDDTTTEIRLLWKGKFRRLLAEDPELAGEMQAIVNLWQNEANSKNGPQTMITQTASARDSSRIYQQGSGTQYNG
jgi:ATP-dependent protease HslVU (ClpYQ) ATPase subunit